MVLQIPGTGEPLGFDATCRQHRGFAVDWHRPRHLAQAKLVEHEPGGCIVRPMRIPRVSPIPKPIKGDRLGGLPGTKI